MRSGLKVGCVLALTLAVGPVVACGGGNGNVNGNVNENVNNNNQACEPGTFLDFYTGPNGTEGVGVCVGGTAECSVDGTGYGPCEGEVTPGKEDCQSAGDEDCDGDENEEDEDCTVVETGGCGDGVIQPGEVCDDGDDAPGDGCAADCATVEQNFACPLLARPASPRSSVAMAASRVRRPVMMGMWRTATAAQGCASWRRAGFVASPARACTARSLR